MNKPRVPHRVGAPTPQSWFVSFFFHTAGAKTELSGLMNAEYSMTITSFGVLTVLLFIQARMLLGSSALRAYYSIMLKPGHHHGHIRPFQQRWSPATPLPACKLRIYPSKDIVILSHMEDFTFSLAELPMLSVSPISHPCLGPSGWQPCP